MVCPFRIKHVNHWDRKSDGKYYLDSQTEGEKEMSVMKYVKKPVEIEALQIFGNISEIKEFIGNNGDAYIDDAAYQAGVHPPVTVVIIHTLEGDMRATDGDYIIKGVKGEFYPCRKDIFEETYERIDKRRNDKCKECKNFDDLTQQCLRSECEEGE